MECKHKNKLTVYGRDKKNWINALKIRGNTVYICEDCGLIYEDKPEVVMK